MRKAVLTCALLAFAIQIQAKVENCGFSAVTKKFWEVSLGDKRNAVVKYVNEKYDLSNGYRPSIVGESIIVYPSRKWGGLVAENIEFNFNDNDTVLYKGVATFKFKNKEEANKAFQDLVAETKCRRSLSVDQTSWTYSNTDGLRLTFKVVEATLMVEKIDTRIAPKAVKLSLRDINN